MLKKLLPPLAVLIAVAFSSSCKKDCKDPLPEDRGGDTTYVQTTPWPKWVFQHWIWEGEGTTQSARQIVDDYLANGIPVDAIIIDSPWETAYNDFQWDSTRYPDAQGMIDYFHSKNIKVLCWITGSIDTSLHPLWDYAKDHNYFMQADANSGPAMVEWWKPVLTSPIDFFNPDAVAWWKGLMDKTLATGIDGWKCDGSDFLLYDVQNFKTYFYSPYLGTNITRNDYSDKYYRLFHDYTRQKLGNDRVMMCRPVDNYGYTFLSGNLVEFGPKDISYAYWVGDQDATFNGMKAALNNMYESDLSGYFSYGSDIGGYRTDNNYPFTGRSKELFIRWAQLSTFNGLMENGGGGEHRPWMFDGQTTEIYRDLVIMRNKYLVGYLMESMKKAVAQNTSLMNFFNKTDYSYMLGDDIYVAPVLGASGNVTVNLPAGSNWVYLYDKTKVYEGGQSFSKTYPITEFPVYLRQGSKIAEGIEP